jgi:hypothetical protein
LFVEALFCGDLLIVNGGIYTGMSALIVDYLFDFVAVAGA